ncbi:MAG: hypothetical protein CM15mV102_150 [uncultured marine virus]|nr:MAG: hypothetical protein CM15mV102_150 [uncultured marine virus]
MSEKYSVEFDDDTVDFIAQQAERVQSEYAKRQERAKTRTRTKTSRTTTS